MWCGSWVPLQQRGAGQAAWGARTPDFSDLCAQGGAWERAVALERSARSGGMRESGRGGPGGAPMKRSAARPLGCPCILRCTSPTGGRRRRESCQGVAPAAAPRRSPRKRKQQASRAAAAIKRAAVVYTKPFEFGSRGRRGGVRAAPGLGASDSAAEERLSQLVLARSFPPRHAWRVPERRRGLPLCC